MELIVHLLPDWKEGTNDIDSYFKVVALDKSWPGDIISDGVHCGFIEKWGTTISAAEDKVVENDYGFRNKALGILILLQSEDITLKLLSKNHFSSLTNKEPNALKSKKKCIQYISNLLHECTFTYRCNHII